MLAEDLSCPDPKTQYTEFIKTLGADAKNAISKVIGQKDSPATFDLLKKILGHYKPDVPDVIVTGGKSRKYKKQKTMKKRHGKTRKLSKTYKGGYVYSASKDLDKASSIISASSSSKSRSNKTKKSRSSK